MGGLFGSKPKMPEIKAPTPVADEEMLAKKRKEKVATMKQRSGRKSTILSDNDTMGGS